MPGRARHGVPQPHHAAGNSRRELCRQLQYSGGELHPNLCAGGAGRRRNPRVRPEVGTAVRSVVLLSTTVWLELGKLRGCLRSRCGDCVVGQQRRCLREDRHVDGGPSRGGCRCALSAEASQCDSRRGPRGHRQWRNGGGSDRRSRQRLSEPALVFTDRSALNQERSHRSPREPEARAAPQAPRKLSEGGWRRFTLPGNTTDRTRSDRTAGRCRPQRRSAPGRGVTRLLVPLPERRTSPPR